MEHVEFYDRINSDKQCVWLVIKKKSLMTHGNMNVKYDAVFPTFPTYCFHIRGFYTFGDEGNTFHHKVRKHYPSTPSPTGPPACWVRAPCLQNL
jgi:hypothetical protein